MNFIISSIQQNDAKTTEEWLEFEKLHVHEQEDSRWHLRGNKLNVFSRSFGECDILNDIPNITIFMSFYRDCNIHL